MKCEKCHEEDVLKEKLQSLRDSMELVENESKDLLTNLTIQQDKIKMIQDNMCSFTRLCRKTMSCVKIIRTLAKKYSRKSKAPSTIKLVTLSVITLHYAKKCNALASEGISVVVRKPVSIMGQQEGEITIASYSTIQYIANDLQKKICSSYSQKNCLCKTIKGFKACLNLVSSGCTLDIEIDILCRWLI